MISNYIRDEYNEYLGLCKFWKTTPVSINDSGWRAEYRELLQRFKDLY